MVFNPRGRGSTSELAQVIHAAVIDVSVHDTVRVHERQGFQEMLESKPRGRKVQGAILLDVPRVSA